MTGANNFQNAGDSDSLWIGSSVVEQVVKSQAAGQQAVSTKDFTDFHGNRLRINAKFREGARLF